MYFGASWDDVALVVVVAKIYVGCKARCGSEFEKHGKEHDSKTCSCKRECTFGSIEIMQPTAYIKARTRESDRAFFEGGGR